VISVPAISTEAASRHFAAWIPGVSRATALYGDRDLNFRIETEDRRRLVFKIMRDASPETRESVELQVALLGHLEQRKPDVRTPRPFRAPDGQFCRVIADDAGQPRIAWALSWLDGPLLDSLKTYDDALLDSIGGSVAEVDRALLDFEDPRASRELTWDLARAASLRPLVEQFSPGSRKTIVEGFFGEFEGEILPKLRARPRSVIHNDGGNQHNMILGDSRVNGIIDFGDAVRTHRICGLGIAAAYATFGTNDPLHAIGEVVRGYHRVLPLDDEDLELVTPLAITRLTTSVCISGARARREPDNEYAVVSAAPAWRVLIRLAEIDFSSAAERIREAIDAAD